MVPNKVGIAGAGAMGTGIAMVFVQSGIEVVQFDISENARSKSKAVRESQWDKLVQKGRVSETEVSKWNSMIIETSTLEEFANVEWVVEAVSENLAIKREVVSQLSDIVSSETVVATNTSSISITEIASSFVRPDKVVGMHFFNPAPVMKLVEVIRGLKTSDETVERTLNLARHLRKEPVLVSKDSPGFIVNRLMFAQMVEAMKIAEQGVATIEEIDKAMVLGLNHPMGPFQLQDYTGIDVCYDVLNSMYNALADPNFAPPLSMRLNVSAGRLGKKSGAGWYTPDGE